MSPVFFQFYDYDKLRNASCWDLKRHGLGVVQGEKTSVRDFGAMFEEKMNSHLVNSMKSRFSAQTVFSGMHV